MVGAYKQPLLQRLPVCRLTDDDKVDGVGEVEVDVEVRVRGSTIPDSRIRFGARNVRKPPYLYSSSFDMFWAKLPSQIYLGGGDLVEPIKSWFEKS